MLASAGVGAGTGAAAAGGSAAAGDRRSRPAKSARKTGGRHCREKGILAGGTPPPAPRSHSLHRSHYRCQRRRPLPRQRNTRVMEASRRPSYRRLPNALKGCGRQERTARRRVIQTARTPILPCRGTPLVPVRRCGHRLRIASCERPGIRSARPLRPSDVSDRGLNLALKSCGCGDGRL